MVATLQKNVASAPTRFREQIGLGNVNNTSDALKPISTATQTALDLKLDANSFGVVLKHLGAPCNGTDDDGVYVQQAYNAGYTNIILTEPECRLNTIPQIPAGGVAKFMGGLSKDGKRPRIRGLAQGTFFFTRETATFADGISGLHLEGVWFDGENTRTAGNYPYRTDVGPRGPSSVFSLFADPANPNCFTKVIDCEFTNFASYPYQFYGFAGKNEGRGNIFTRTKDPGYIHCHNGWWTGNLMRYSADNGVSISRGCTNWTISDNLAHDCEFAGIWVAGYNIQGSGTATVTGTYTVGGTVSLTLSTAQLQESWEDTILTLEDVSNNSTMIKLTSVTSSTSATGLVMTAVPAGLQGIASDQFFLAPMLGPVGVTLSNNIVIGCGIAALQMTTAPKGVTVDGETYLRSGWVADSEVTTRGSIASGSNQLVLTSATNFTTPGYVLLKPYNSQQTYRIVRAISKAGNTLTLNAVINASYMDVEVRPLHNEAGGGFAIFIDGNGVGVNEYAEDLHFSNITIRDYYGDMIRIGNTAKGTARHCSFTDIYHRQQEGQASSSRQIVAFYEGLTSDQTAYMTFDRFVSDDSAAFIEIFQHGTAQRTFEFNDLRLPNVSAANLIVAKDLDNANAVIPNLYNFSRIGQDGVRRQNASKLEQSTAVTATAGVIDVISAFMTYSPTAANVDITSFLFTTLPAPGGSLPVFGIRNTHATNTFTLKHNLSLIRTHTGADVIVNPNGIVWIQFINSSIAQVQYVSAP